MQKKPVGPRISQYAREFYELTFQGVNRGAGFALEAFPAHYRRALSEMGHLFTESEKSALVEISGNTELDPLRPGHRIVVIAGRMLSDKNNNRGISDPELLLTKLSRLPVWHCFILTLWGKRCGNAADEKYAKIFAELESSDATTPIDQATVDREAPIRALQRAPDDDDVGIFGQEVG